MKEHRDLRQADVTVSPRFTQISTFARLPHVVDPDQVDAVFLGIPFDDATTFRSGARMGPSGVRENSRLLRPYNMFIDVSPFEVLGVADYGDVNVVPGSFHDTAQEIEATLDTLLTHKVIPLICGGDHSITLPILRALAKEHGPVNLLHFDAHWDFRDGYRGQKYNHGTWLRRALEEGLLNHVAQAGIRGSQLNREDLSFPKQHGITVQTIKDFHGKGVEGAMAVILEALGGTEPLYLSWDIDVIDPAYAMGTGTPEVGGLNSWQALECVRMLVGRRLVGMDVVEVAPPYDAPGAITSIMAANLLYEGLSTIAKNEQQGLKVYR